MIENIINPLHFPGDPRIAHIMNAILIQLLVFVVYGGVLSIPLFYIKPGSKRNSFLGVILCVAIGIVTAALQTIIFCKFYSMHDQAVSFVLIVFMILNTVIAFHLYNLLKGNSHGPTV